MCVCLYRVCGCLPFHGSYVTFFARPPASSRLMAVQLYYDRTISALRATPLPLTFTTMMITGREKRARDIMRQSLTGNHHAYQSLFFLSSDGPASTKLSFDDCFVSVPPDQETGEENFPAERVSSVVYCLAISTPATSARPLTACDYAVSSQGRLTITMMAQ